jgi:protein pelota
MLTKQHWDQFTLEQVQEAANPLANATVAAVLLQTGVANVCVVGRNCTRIVDHLEKATPKLKKVGGSEKVSVAKRALFERAAASLSEKVELGTMKVVIVASPGFLAREFVQFLRENAPKFPGVQPAFQANKFIEATVPNAYLDSLEDLLMQPEMEAHVQDMRAVRQAKMLGEFERQMSHDFQMVSLGEQNVLEDLTNKVVRVLLVTDEYLLELEFERRRILMQLRDRLVEGGDEALVFSIKHPSGQRLKDLTAGVGIAALLKTRVLREYQPDGFDDEGGMPV